MQDLGTLGGSKSIGFGISDDGAIVGQAALAEDTASHAFLHVDGQMKDLGTLGGSESLAYRIKSLGHIVGWSSTSMDPCDHALSTGTARKRVRS